MAINKLNLNGTTYDIGEAAGTNTAESVVEFSSADEENPSSADESVALIKSGDTHKSLLEKISAGMKNIRYLLKQVTSLNSALAEYLQVEIYYLPDCTIAGNGSSGVLEYTFSPPNGYTAIGIVGLTPFNGNINISRLYLSNDTTLSYGFTNRSSDSITFPPRVQILFSKNM